MADAEKSDEGKTHAVIIGATGLVGSACLPLLLKRYDSVTAFVRKPTGRLHPRLTERRIAFDRLDTVEVPRGSHVFSALGSTIKKAGSQEAFRRIDFDYPRMLASRAAQAGRARFILVSSVSASARSGNFYLRIKGELEEALSAMPLEAVHIFRPSILAGDREENRPAEKIALPVSKAVAFLLIGPLRKYRAIPAETVAKAMVAAANIDARGTIIYHYDEIRRLAASIPNDDSNS